MAVGNDRWVQFGAYHAPSSNITSTYWSFPNLPLKNNREAGLAAPLSFAAFDNSFVIRNRQPRFPIAGLTIQSPRDSISAF